MATTLHLGDCLNGCDVCRDRWHEDIEDQCLTCGVEL